MHTKHLAEANINAVVITIIRKTTYCQRQHCHTANTNVVLNAIMVTSLLLAKYLCEEW